MNATATLTTNLFHGQGDRNHRLEVVEGAWPTDLDGGVLIVGPDKPHPGGHWFDGPGLVARIELVPDALGRIPVTVRRIRTPLAKIRERVPGLFRKVAFLELSPFGLSNLANTNVEPIAGRCFVGYDAGRPIEIDPTTLEYLTPVGANDEWHQSVPGLLEPGISVAAHPAASPEESTLYFVNYDPVPTGRRTFIARWRLDGPVERWRLGNIGEFDSIHDVKASRRYLVISDLPFVVEPEAVMGKGPRTRANQTHTSLWIVAKDDLTHTPIGGTVPVREVRLPMPTGHLVVDEDDDEGLVVRCEHIPLQDLQVVYGPTSRRHLGGGPIDPEYWGMVMLSVQPHVVGRYVIDLDGERARVREQQTATDERFWGAVLGTYDRTTPAARARVEQGWYAGMGFDPAMVTEEWWSLYGEDTRPCVVEPSAFPTDPRPAALAHFDLTAMKLVDSFEFDAGRFPTPPTFVPRRGAETPNDGYVVVLVHQDGAKAIQVFDAQDVGRGPIATATAPDFHPNLLLHSCYVPPDPSPRPDYRVPVGRDVIGALRRIPTTVAALVRTGRATVRETRAASSAAGTVG